MAGLTAAPAARKGTDASYPVACCSHGNPRPSRAAAPSRGSGTSGSPPSLARCSRPGPRCAASA
eukprot:4083954-Pyramimonas_sp.AAC.1